MQAGAEGYKKEGAKDDAGCADQRGHFVWSLQPDRGRKASHERRRPVELSGRALDILIALLSNPNEVVSKHDVLSQVWPDVTVEEGSLRFHMANLRKVLDDGQDGPRCIATVPGRGYCFVAPISRSSD